MKLLMLLLIAGLAPSALAQSSPVLNHQSSSTALPTNVKSVASNQQDDPVAIAIEKAVNRALLAEEKVKLFEEKLLVKDERIANLLDINAQLKQDKADLLEANKNRRDAGNIDTERLADAKQLIAKQDAEIARLRSPGFFASLFDKRTIYGAVAGYGVCRLTTGTKTITVSNPFANINSATGAGNWMMIQSPAEQRMRDALKSLKK